MKLNNINGTSDKTCACGSWLNHWKTFSRHLMLVGIGVIFLCLSARSAAAQSEYAGRGGWGAATSVYRILCPDHDRGGTAFGHRSGRIITAEHVIHECDPRQLKVIARDGSTSGITAVVGDADLDLALLTPSISDFVKNPLGIASEDGLTIGQQVSTWGYPEGYGGAVPLLSLGYFAGVDEQHPKPGEVIRKWAVNGAFNRGNSGGPLLETKTATVIGVISSKLAPMPRELMSQLERVEKNGSANEKTIAKVVEQLRGQTQLVIGFATLTKDLRDFLVKNRIEP